MQQYVQKYPNYKTCRYHPPPYSPNAWAKLANFSSWEPRERVLLGSSRGFSNFASGAEILELTMLISGLQKCTKIRCGTSCNSGASVYNSRFLDSTACTSGKYNLLKGSIHLKTTSRHRLPSLRKLSAVISLVWRW